MTPPTPDWLWYVAANSLQVTLMSIGTGVMIITTIGLPHFLEPTLTEVFDRIKSWRQARLG